MTPINNSDTAWLIATDFNQDNGKHYQELRDDIISPDVERWCYEPQWMIGYLNVGSGHHDAVGDYSDRIFYHGIWIGGSDPEDMRIKSLVGGHDTH